LALIVAGRIFVLRPLLMASENVIGLSKGKLEVLASPTSSGEVKRLFNALEDLRTILSQRIEYTEQLKILSETDGLTGLVNRRLFDQIGTGAAEFATFPRSIGLILMDLDWFKRVNDTYGHLVGDLVLKHTASIVRRICRQGDIAARLGGEEIAIIVMDPAPMTSTHAIAECIRAELERSPITLDNGQVFVTASFGVAFGERGPTTWTYLIADADACLYRAKSQGRNRVCSTVDAGSASIAAGLITLQSAAIKAAEAASSTPLVHALEMSA
jgi:diguanylate cyclase (GGDEF)-like protein